MPTHTLQVENTDPKAAVHKPETKKKISLVVPGYNEGLIVQQSFATLCRYMEKLEDRYDWELIFVNDGSSDETGEIAEKFAEEKENFFIYHNPYNFRLGQALRHAFRHCCGDYVVVLDLDLSYSPDHIERLIAKIISTKAKIVIASPYMHGGQVSNVPFLRKFLSVWANRFLSFLLTRDYFSDRITTITGMVRAYDREFLNRLNLKAMDVSINSEIIYKAMILRARIVEIPAHLDWGTEKADKKGGSVRKSSMRIARSILQSLISGFIFRPFLFFIAPGLLVLTMSLFTLFHVSYYTIINYSALPATQSIPYRFGTSLGEAFQISPHSFIVGGISLIVGIQLVSLGVLALQKKRYFEELYHLGSSIRSHTIAIKDKITVL